MDDRTRLEDDPGAQASAHALAPECEATLRGGIRTRLGERAIVLVGLMGAGKSTVGRRLANRLGLPFKDADHEIEAAAGMTIPDIFAIYGEPSFRDGERKVVTRLLLHGPLVLATGGGAYMDPETRTSIAAHGVSVWLKADFEVLMRRVRKRGNRPLLKTPDPEATMRRLIDTRYPIYAEADLTVESRDVTHERVVDTLVEALDGWLGGAADRSRPPCQGAVARSESPGA